MDLGLASWNFLLHLLLLLAYRGGARVTKWEELEGSNIESKEVEILYELKANINHGHRKDFPGSGYLENDDVRNTNKVIGSGDGGDDSHGKDDTDMHRRVLSQQNAMNNHQTIQAKLNHDANDHSSSYMDQIEHSIFFTIDALQVGKILPSYFPLQDPSTSPPLLPREKANSIPFSLKQLPHLLQLFSFSHDSPEAKLVEDALTMCERKPMKGETKCCPTSLESMLDFARSILGLETKLKFVSTTYVSKSTTYFQNYTILQVPKEIYAPKMIACHSMTYPYAVFYCHSQTENKLFKVSLGAEDGDRVEAVAVCHMDTSQWSPKHLSFHVLGIKPGKNSHVCHLFAVDSLVFVPAESI